MKRIFKYHAPVMDHVNIAMPEGAEIPCVQIQDGEPYVWKIGA